MNLEELALLDGDVSLKHPDTLQHFVHKAGSLVSRLHEILLHPYNDL